jgi:hypothetical protein
MSDYDQHQAEAVEFKCPECGKTYFVTKRFPSRKKCLLCEPWDHTKKPSHTDVSGVEMTDP